MLYYKYLEIDNFEIIQQKTLEYLKLNNIFDQQKFHWVQFDDLIKFCPELHTAFDRYSIKPCGAAAIVSKTKYLDIHIDSVPYKCRINIPIANCQGSKTLFFEGGEFDVMYTHNGLPYFKLKPSSIPTLKQVAEVEIIKPTVIRVHVPHRVITNLERIPRVTLSIKFDVDPEFLLNN